MGMGAPVIPMNGSRGRLQHDVRSDAFYTLRRFCQQAGCQSHNQHHQGHFDRDGEDTYQGAQRPVQ
jgi:hypothetical protein